MVIVTMTDTLSDEVDIFYIVIDDTGDEIYHVESGYYDGYLFKRYQLCK